MQLLINDLARYLALDGKKVVLSAYETGVRCSCSAADGRTQHTWLQMHPCPLWLVDASSFWRSLSFARSPETNNASKAAPFFAQKVTAANLIFGAANTLAFWTPTRIPGLSQAVRFADNKVPELNLGIDEELQASNSLATITRGYSLGVPLC
jgi:hypothetical protein